MPTAGHDVPIWGWFVIGLVLAAYLGLWLAVFFGPDERPK